MSNLRQAAQAVIDQWDGPHHDVARMHVIYLALRTALAAPEQEPTAWVFTPNRELLWPAEVEATNPISIGDYKPLYASPVDIEALTKERDELIVVLKFVESVYRQNFVAVGEPSSTLAYMQSVIAKVERDDLLLKIDSLCHEVAAIPEIKAERDALARGIDQWRTDYHELRLERDAFAVDLAKSEDYAKSEYLLREKLEEERDAHAAAAKLAHAYVEWQAYGRA